MTSTRFSVEKLMLAALVALVFIVMMSLSHAVYGQTASADLTWTHPTQRVDGTALALTEIRETQLDWAKCTASNTFPITVEGTRAVPAPATTASITGLTYGTWCFRARSADTDGRVSDNSGTVWKRYLAPPRPPVITTVGGLVWEMKWNNKEGAYLAKVVGTIDAGAPCYGLAPALGFDLFPVDRADVDLSRNVGQGATLVAQCNISDAG